MSVTAIVMAAGSSERMGRPKLLLPYRGGTILDATIATVLASPIDAVLVVTGADADAIEASLGDTPVRIVRNPDHRRGNMSSLLTATAADSRAAAFLQVPGDVPELELGTLEAVLGAWDAQRPWAAVTRYRDRIAHPFLLSAGAVAAVSDVTGPKALWRVLVESEDERVAQIAVATPAPADINTPDDYQALLERATG